MYSKNVMARLFPSLSEDDDYAPLDGPDRGLTDDSKPKPKPPTLADLAPVLSQFPDLGRYLQEEAPRAQPDVVDQPGTEQPPTDPSRNGFSPHTLEEVNAQEQPMQAGDPTGANFDNFGWDSNAGYVEPATPTQPQRKVYDPTAAGIGQHIADRRAEPLIDKNHGVKGRIWEGLQNALQGISMVYQRNPRASVLEELAGAGGGVVHGLVDRTWNENRARDRDLGELQSQFDQASGNEKAIAETRLRNAQAATIPEDDARMKAKDVDLALHRKRADLLKQVNALPSFDPDDPENADMVAALKGAGLPVIPKQAQTSFKYITDSKSGKVYVDLSDKAGHRHLVQLTNDDGTDLTITTPQMMSSSDKAEQRALQERIAKEGNVTKLRVAEIGAASRKEVATLNQGAITGRENQTQATRAAQTFAAIEVNAPKGSTPEQIKAAQQRYLQSLPPAVKAQLPQQ